MLEMFLKAAGGDQDVVEVDEDEVQIAAYSVHESLKRLGGILQPEGGPHELPQAERCDHSGLGDVSRSDGDLVISTDQVDFGKNCFSSQEM